MGKKVNTFLLLMILLVLMGFGGVSVYYQYTFKNINEDFDSISTNLASCEQNLSQTADTLIKAIRKLNSTELDIRKYDKLYEEQTGQLEETEEDLDRTKSELNRMTLLGEVWRKERDAAVSQIKVLNKSISTLNSRINTLENTINRLKDDIDCLLDTNDADETDLCI